MKYSTLAFSALFLSALGSCVQATVTEPSSCDTQTITWQTPDVTTSVSISLDASLPDAAILESLDGGIPAGITVPPMTASVNFDFSSMIDKLSDITDNIQVNVSQLSLSDSNGALDWVSNTTVQITGSTPTTGTATLGQSEKDPLVIAIKMNGPDILRYLTSGPVTLAVTLSGVDLTESAVLKLAAVGSSLSSTLTMCVPVQGKFSKSVL